MPDPSSQTQTDNKRRMLNIVLPLLLGAVFLCNLAYSFQVDVWAPRNELAHFDYIYKMSKLDFPGNADPISAQTFDMTMDGLTWKKPSDFSGSIESMGIEGVSYEAQQPPLYYAVMAVPELIIRPFNLSTKVHVRALRGIHLLIATLGMALCVPIFRELHKLWGVDPIYGWFIAIGMALVTTKEFTTLGNDGFSPLIGNATILVTLFAIRGQSTGVILVAAILPALAFLTKYTNGIYLVFHLALAAIWLLRRDSISATRKLIIAAIPLAIVASYLAFNVVAYGDLMKSGSTMDTFAHTHGTQREFGAFAPVFLKTSFRLNHLGIFLPNGIVRLFVAMLALNIAITTTRVFRDRTPNWDAFILLVSLFAGGLLVLAFLLNRFHPGVWWSAFRHFSGYYFFWFLAAFHIPFSPPENRRTTLHLVMTAALAALVARYVYMMLFV